VLKHKLIHPDLNRIVGAAGHHAKILIADGNYPASSKKAPGAELVHLNLMPGLCTCAQVLEAILSAVPVEEINTMMYETEGPYALSEDPPVWSDYKKVIAAEGLDLELKPIEKRAFYEAGATPHHALTVQTADTQRYANILLSVGVRMDV